MGALKIFVASILAGLIGFCIGELNVAGKVGQFLGEILSDGKTAVAVVAAATTLLSLTVQLAVGTRQAAASQTAANASMLTARNAGTRAISTMRLSWLERLRKTLSEYHSILMTTDEESSESDKRRLSDLGTHLDLMLNQDEADQKRLWDISDKIFNLPKLEDREALDKDLIIAGREVLKNEWEKIKREQRGISDHSALEDKRILRPILRNANNAASQRRGWPGQARP